MNKCCICKKEYDGYGNNPSPIRFIGRCCDKCNLKYVIPMRMSMLLNDQKKGSKL